MSDPRKFSSFIKTILVLTDTSPSCSQRIESALHLAQEHGAHLAGLFIRSFPCIPPFILAQLGEEILQSQNRHIIEEEEKAKSLFLEKTKGADAEWIAINGSLQAQSIRFAHQADIVITSQFNPEDIFSEDQNTLLEHLVLSSGRPLIVLPSSPKTPLTPPLAFATHVLVAWNGTRECTRALHDALPVLLRAQGVEIATFLPRSANAELFSERKEDMESLARHLCRHGVAATSFTQVSSEPEISEAIQVRATQIRADLLVMGAYGRSRLMELILGGTTRCILRHTNIPVLLSH